VNAVAGTVHACPHRRGRRQRPAPRLAEHCVRRLPKSLTEASRKRSPGHPVKAHPTLPERLTGPSRTSSPTPPADAHRPFPERLTGASRKGSPAVPGKAHRMLPYWLTQPLPEKLTRGSRKISPLFCFRCCGCECGCQHAALRRPNRRNAKAVDARNSPAADAVIRCKRLSPLVTERRIASRIRSNAPNGLHCEP